MKLTILGATGHTGQEITKQALAAGHEVTVLARDPTKLGDLRSKVRVVQGSSMELEPMEDAITGADAVLSALGHVRASPPNLLAKSASNLVDGMKRHGVKRLVVLSNVAVRDPSDQPSLYNRFLLMLLTAFRGAMVRDTVEEVRIISESDLDWTIVRANLLTFGSLTKRYRAGAFDRNSKARVSRADTADFMIVCAVENKFVRAKPLISE